MFIFVSLISKVCVSVVDWCRISPSTVSFDRVGLDEPTEALKERFHPVNLEGISSYMWVLLIRVITITDS